MNCAITQAQKKKKKLNFCWAKFLNASIWKKKEEIKTENLPSILMIEKTGENDVIEGGSNANTNGDKKIII